MPGKRQLNTRNHRAFEEWMTAKKIGRKKQVWVKYVLEEDGRSGGYWRKDDGT